MIARLIGWSAKNLMLVLVATAFVVVGGVWALRTLPLDAIPAIRRRRQEQISRRAALAARLGRSASVLPRPKALPKWPASGAS